MPFSEIVREEALVKSARRCNVCREFAGRAVNVHHITQEADGGSNSIENAIVLCLRCHSEAGHFNSRHPIGTKYSPSELRRQRDQFQAAVAAGQILPATSEMEISWKRSSPFDGDLHTYHLIASVNNGSNSLNRWKLQIGLPSCIPIEYTNLKQSSEILREGVRYLVLEAEGGSLFPGETSNAVGPSAGATLQYQMNHELFYASDSKCWRLWLRLYTDSGPPIEGSRHWSEIHIF